MVPDDASGSPGRHGAAIYADAANVTIHTSTFVANYAYSGSCILGIHTAIVMIYSSHFKSNGSPAATQGGAIGLVFGAVMEVYGSTFIENVVGSDDPVSAASCSLFYQPLVILAMLFL
jgi:hypothetical protein